MTISGVLVILGVPLVVSGVLQLIRRWPTLLAWTTAITAALLGVLVTFAPFNDPISLGSIDIVLGRSLVVLGRSLVVERVDRLPLTFMFFTSAGLFVLAWRLLPRSNFFPIGLTMVTLLAGALLVQQVVYAALLVEMAIIFAVFPLHEPIVVVTKEGERRIRYGLRTKGGVRYMAYATLALPGLMVTQLLLELFASFPNDLGLLQASTVLLGLSFAILLGAVPFQSWLSTVATDGSPPVVTFLFTVNLGTVWFMLLAYLETYSWLGNQAAFGPLFTIVGLLMIVTGGVLAASQRRLGRLVGYATLVENGAMFVALGTRQVTGLALTVMLLIARPLALGLMTMGLEGLRRLGGGDDSVAAIEGAAWRAPWRTAAFLVGGIAMAGFPLSLGFAARWGLYRLLAQQSFFQAVLALSGSAGVMMGLIGAIRTLLAPVGEESRHESLGEDPVVVALIVLLIGVTLILGLFPQSASRVALQMAEGFTFFSSETSF